MKVMWVSRKGEQQHKENGGLGPERQKSNKNSNLCLRIVCHSTLQADPLSNQWLLQYLVLWHAEENSLKIVDLVCLF